MDTQSYELGLRSDVRAFPTSEALSPDIPSRLKAESSVPEIMCRKTLGKACHFFYFLSWKGFVSLYKLLRV